MKTKIFEDFFKILRSWTVLPVVKCPSIVSVIVVILFTDILCMFLFCIGIHFFGTWRFAYMYHKTILYSHSVSRCLWCFYLLYHIWPHACMHAKILPVAVLIWRTLSSIFGSIFADSSFGLIFPRSFSDP